MRPSKLEIKNITSLRGTHTIEFDQIFSENSLFAITGSTGSGKSTLLSSISLSLFGKHYKTSLNAADFVTQGEREGSIEFTFFQNGVEYKALWLCSVLKKDFSKKKNPTPTRQLLRDGSPTDEKIEDILGLTFDQFCKVVILNQGEFSKFLNCSYTERKDILEKIARVDQLKGLSKTLNKEISNLSLKIEEKEGGLDQFEIIPTEEFNEAQITISNIKESLPKSEDLYRKKSECLRLLKDVQEVSHKFFNNKVRIENNTKLLTQKQKELNHGLEELKELQVKEEKLKKQTDIKAPKLKQLINTLSKEEGLATKIQNNKEVLKDISKRRNEKEQQNRSLESEISNIEKDNNLLINDISNWSKVEIEENIENINSFVNYQEQLDEIEKENAEYLNQLDNIQKDGRELSSSSQEIKNDYIEELFLNNSNLPIQNLQTQYTELKKRISNYYESYQQNLNEITSLDFELKEFDASLKNKKTELADKNVILKQNEIINANLITIEALIRENENNCSICDTPLDKKKLYQKLETTKSSFQHEIKEIIIKLERDIKDIEKKKSINQVNSDSLKNQNVKLTTEINRFYQTIEDITLLKEISKNTEFLTSIKNTEDAMNIFENIDSKIDQIKVYLQNYNSVQEIDKKTNTLREKYTTINNVFKKLKDKSNNLKDKLEQIKILDTKKEIIKSSADLSLLKKNLSSLLEKINQSEQNKLKIDEKKKTQQSNIEYLKNLLENETQTIHNQDLNEAESKKLTTEISNLSTELSLKNEKTNIKAVQELQSEMENSLYMATKELDKKQAGLREVQTEFSKLETLLRTIKEQNHDIEKVISNNLMNLKELNNDFSNQVIEKITSLKNIDEIANQNEKISLYIQNELSPQCFELEKEIESLKKSKYELEEKVRTYKKLEEAKSAIKDQVLSLKNQLSLFEDLIPFIGQDKFREFALKAIESQLLLFTNKELEKLCDGRYQLISPYLNARREFFVIDNWSEGEYRKVSTLSGGETFMISLGLALGLSEMNRGHTNIDCFFIDEGFGTLDSESINEVIECLYNIQAQGKYIGLISHIKELTERIPVNIQLAKGQTGNSSLSLKFT
ncbi:MAG: SMC family ATPase [Oligoflexia bacterium]|nr:SMC family ATPase [Oligoflexia bacterium]